MEIAVHTIESALSAQTLSYVPEFFKEIEKHMPHTLKEAPLEQFAKADFRLLFVASGGSEEGFLKEYELLTSKPCYILTSGESNSLAASMEILSYLQNHGGRGEIIHGDPSLVAGRISALLAAAKAVSKLRGAKLGVVGKPSDWLIASEVDENALKQKLGIELVRVPMSELFEEIEKNDYPENEWTKKLLACGYDEAEVKKALGVYGAFRRIVDKYGLAGITVRCFDLLGSVKTTGCLGLAILNAEGVYGGCEGDIPSLISMAVLGAISGEPVFMCNPSRIDTGSREMVFAHCTLPLNMPYESSLTTHYESGIGVAIAGSIPEGPCTVFKTDGALERRFAARGEIIANLREKLLCRSQIKLKISPEAQCYFLREPINNHHLVCVGDWTSACEEFFSML
ncbi:MAG: hypothetical protein Q4B42_00595 [Oscillospiraceae bacterium]|nr:hypothetical protein [Oscillospiraceae bacterium]